MRQLLPEVAEVLRHDRIVRMIFASILCSTSGGNALAGKGLPGARRIAKKLAE